MSLHLAPATPRQFGTASLLRLILSGPRQLITTGLTFKSAALMILLCIPTLLVVAMITVPGILFSAQQNEAYHFFANNLNRDLNNGIVLTVMATFMLAAVMMPGITQRSFSENARA